MALLVDIWSDIACPWCYVGKKRIERAAQNAGIELQVEWHSFELDPAPLKKGDERDYAQRLADKYGRSRAQAAQMIAQMTQTGAGEGIEFNFSKMVPTNTLSAHRLLHWAKQQSLEAQGQLKQAFLEAHFSKGRDLNDENVLLSVVASVGLDVDAACAVLNSDEFLSDVREDQAEAQSLSITGVPFFVIGEFGVGGAQQVEVFESAFAKVLAQSSEMDLGEGSVCTPEGC